jgi:hypothetical protein
MAAKDRDPSIERVRELWRRISKGKALYKKMRAANLALFEDRRQKLNSVLNTVKENAVLFLDHYSKHAESLQLSEKELQDLAGMRTDISGSRAYSKQANVVLVDFGLDLSG